MEQPRGAAQSHPKLKACLLSKIFSCWSLHLVKKSHQRKLDEDDIYNPLPEDGALKLSDDLERAWEFELKKRHESGHGHPNLIWAIWHRFAMTTTIFSILLYSLSVAASIGQAILLGQLLDSLETKSLLSSERHLYALGLCICFIFQVLLDQWITVQETHCGLQIRIAICTLIYKKILKLCSIVLSKTNIGQIVNLFSNEVQKLDHSIKGIHTLIVTPFEIAAIVALLWLQLGPSCLAGLGILVILLPVQASLWRISSKLRIQRKDKTSRRGLVMNELISGIRLIKMYCWEIPFTLVIESLRWSELGIVRRILFSRGVIATLNFVKGKLALFTSIMTFVLTQNYLTARRVFESYLLFEILRRDTSLFLRWLFQHGPENLNIFRKVQKFLLMEEHLTIPKGPSLDPLIPLDTAIRFENLSVCWRKETNCATLRGLNMSIQKGQLVVVTGPPGSGKTSLLMAILQEIPVLAGNIYLHGSLSYISQNTWCFPGTVRDNIIFGSDFDQDKYIGIIQACTLQMDLEILPYGDQTILGDPTLRISKKLQIKINIARVLYHPGNIVLIDDVLDHLDYETSRWIFNKSICTWLCGHTRILVTRCMDFVKSSDKVIILNQGIVSNHGRFDDLKHSDTELMTMLWKYKESFSHLDSTLAFLHHRIQTSNTDIRPLTSAIKGPLADTDSQHGIDDDKTRSPHTLAYWKYFMGGGGPLALLSLVLFIIISQAAFVLTDWWLAYWSRKTFVPWHNTSYHHFIFSSFNSSYMSDLNHVFTVDIYRHLYVYVGLVCGLVLFSSTWVLVFFSITLTSAKTLHHKLFSSLMKAPVRFFDVNTTSSILTRLCDDMGHSDDYLPTTLFDCIQHWTLAASCIIVICVVNYWLVIICIILLAIFLFLHHLYLQAAQDLSDIASQANSRLSSLVMSTLEGLHSVRAAKSHDRLHHVYLPLQNLLSSTASLYYNIYHWFAVMQDLLCTLAVLAVTFGAVLLSAVNGIDGSLAGLSVIYVLTLRGTSLSAVKQSTRTAGQMCSLERVLEYTRITSEAPPHTSLIPPMGWPRYGIITFERVSLSHEEGGPLLLKSLWCCIRGREKVGVLNASGDNGKYLADCLMRLTEPRGIVRIDGINIWDLGLRDLREKISVIPEEPFIFTGTVRYNLDPFLDYTDAQLWKALETVHLKEVIDSLPGKLYTKLIAPTSSNLGATHLQLMGLARAILKNNTILIMHETKQNKDPRTEAIIHQVIREQFRHCTVLTVAHRIRTVIDCDRLMVLSRGRIKEFDPPHILLQNPKSLFAMMVEQCGVEESERLQLIARAVYEKPGTCSFSDHSDQLTANGQNAAGIVPIFQSNRMAGVFGHIPTNRI